MKVAISVPTSYLEITLPLSVREILTSSPTAVRSMQDAAALYSLPLFGIAVLSTVKSMVGMPVLSPYKERVAPLGNTIVCNHQICQFIHGI